MEAINTKPAIVTTVETVRGPVARAHIDRLSRKYRGRDYDPARITSERVILRIVPEVQRVH